MWFFLDFKFSHIPFIIIAPIMVVILTMTAAKTASSEPGLFSESVHFSLFLSIEIIMVICFVLQKRNVDLVYR